MKLSRNSRWLVLWCVLTARFAALDALDYGIHKMRNGQTMSALLMVIAAVMTGYRLSVLDIQHWVESRYGS